MFKFSHNYLTGDNSVEIVTSEDAELFGKFIQIFARKDNYLDYSLAKATEAYGSVPPWVHHRSDGGSSAPVAYHLVFDYRGASYDIGNWGSAKIIRRFDFPAELVEHQKSMIDRMTKEKRIKRNSTCPRVASLEVSDEGPKFIIELADYYSQVGTNLTLDYPLKVKLSVGETDCSTVREWDRAQAGIEGKGLPSLERSRLANTIGVAIGLSARSKDGIKHYIYRYRPKHLAVYPNTWHLPVSFALEVDGSIQNGESCDVSTLILKDFRKELSDEAALYEQECHPLRPLAFCRDLFRGGKPQFFCELESKLELEVLIDRIIRVKSPEYAKRPKVVLERKALLESEVKNIPPSPELACFLALKSDDSKSSG